MLSTDGRQKRYYKSLLPRKGKTTQTSEQTTIIKTKGCAIEDQDNKGVNI